MNNNLLIGGIALIFGGYWWSKKQPKRWIFKGKSRTAKELKELGFVPYGGNWIPADYLNQELDTNETVGGFISIIKSGVGLFNDITKVVATLKGKKEGTIPSDGNLPCAIFAGVADNC